MSLGTNIAYYRKQKKLTQAELGELVGISNQAVSKWEAELTMPDVMLLPQIAAALSVKLEDLYRDPDTPAEARADSDRRILHISHQQGETKTELRVPIASLRAAMEGVLGEDGKRDTEALMAMLDGPAGEVVNTTGKKGHTVITVEAYEN